MVKQYPHLMERYPDYHSASVLGKIYDEVKSQESEADPSISKWLISLISLFPLTTEMVTNFLLFSTLFFFLLLSEIVPLQCFTEVAVSEDYKRRWTSLYQEYLRESSKLCKLEDKAERNINFHELYQEYKWVSILLPNGRHLKFKGCPKSRQVFFLAGFCRCCTRPRSLSTARGSALISSTRPVRCTRWCMSTQCPATRSASAASLGRWQAALCASYTR